MGRVVRVACRPWLDKGKFGCHRLARNQGTCLAQYLDELGLTASSPDELARLLRENAILEQLGYGEGATLQLAPWRAQAGAELALTGRGKAKQQLRVRALVDRTQAVASDATMCSSSTGTR